MYELLEKESLDKYLQDDLGRSRLWSFRRRVLVAIDVVTALEFKSAKYTAGPGQFVNDDKGTGIKGTKVYVCPHCTRSCKNAPSGDVYSIQE